MPQPVLLILIAISVAGVVFLYIWRSGRLRVKISQAVQEQGWSARWKTLAYIPFLGQWIFRKAEAASEHWPRLLVQNALPENLKPIDLSGCQWILFEEQFDRRSGEHHGTLLHPLDPRQQCYELTLGPVISDHAAIAIPPLRHQESQRQGEVLASLEYLPGKDSWQLHNCSRGRCTIPVYQVASADEISPGPIRLVERGYSAALELTSGDQFIIEFVEYKIVRLPRLALFREGLSRGDSLPLPVEGKNPIASGETTPVLQNSFEESAEIPQIKILKDKLFFCSTEISLTPLIGGQQRNIPPGRMSYRLQPGDRFIAGEYTFYVDYLEP